MSILFAPTDDCLRDVAEYVEIQPEDSLRHRNDQLRTSRVVGPCD